jgi:hypothetical protein
MNLEEYNLIDFIIEEHNDLSNVLPNDPLKETLVLNNRNFIYEYLCDLKFKVPIGGFF